MRNSLQHIKQTPCIMHFDFIVDQLLQKRPCQLSNFKNKYILLKKSSIKNEKTKQYMSTNEAVAHD